MKLHRPTVVGLGEVLWDLLPTGRTFGGAPTNFACHAQQLGAAAAVVSCVGWDDLGDDTIAELKRREVSSSGVLRSDSPTGTVEVALDDAGKPTYHIAQEVAWDAMLWSDSLAQLAATSAAVCFGTLGQRSKVSRQTIRRFLSAAPREALRLFDVNLRASFFEAEIILQSLELANVLKLSDEELPLVAKFCDLSGTMTEVIEQLASRFDLQVVALTLGSQGAILLGRGKNYRHPAACVEVVDTVGAGDAYTAALALGLLTGHDLGTINGYACKIAAFVCSQTGATPVIPSELIPADF